MDDKQITDVVKRDMGWLIRHERMVICALVLMVAMFLGNKWLDSSATKAQAQATVAAQLASDAKLSAKQAAEQAVQTQAQYQVMVETLQKQNAILAQAVTQRDAVLGQAQTAVKTAPLTVVAQQWQTAIGGQGDIAPAPSGLNITDDGARRTLSALIELPVVKSDLMDEKKLASNTQTELDGANKSIGTLNTQVTALNTQIAANDKSCKAQLDVVKTEARKSKRNWFIGGLASGVALGIKLMTVL